MNQSKNDLDTLTFHEFCMMYAVDPECIIKILRAGIEQTEMINTLDDQWCMDRIRGEKSIISAKHMIQYIRTVTDSI